MEQPVAIKPTLRQRVTLWLYVRVWSRPKVRKLALALLVLLAGAALGELCELLPDALVRPCHLAAKLLKALSLAGGGSE